MPLAPQLLWPVLCCALCTAALLVSEFRQWRPGVWIFKPLASLCFLWAALVTWAPGATFGRWVLLALGLCLVGDLLLISRDRKELFRAGLGAFLLGHLAYVAAFLTRPISLPTLAVAAIAFALFGFRVLVWLSGSLSSGMRWPVRAYVLAICTMSTLAFAVVGAGAPWVIAAGALAFTASDLAVARERFVHHAFINRAWGLPMYYAAQLTLAISPALVEGAMR